MRLVVDEEALDDLQSIFAWIAKDDVASPPGAKAHEKERSQGRVGPEMPSEMNA